MTTISKYLTLASTEIHDGKGGVSEIKPGSNVDVLPIEFLGHTLGSVSRSSKIENYNLLKQWLGEGPFVVTEIRQWSSGNIMLYLSVRHGSVGVHSYDMMGVK